MATSLRSAVLLLPLLLFRKAYTDPGAGEKDRVGVLFAYATGGVKGRLLFWLTKQANHLYYLYDLYTVPTQPPSYADVCEDCEHLSIHLSSI